MSQTASGTVRKVRPKYLNLLEIRQPIPAWASIMHRVSGAALFFPFALWLLFLFDLSLSSEQGFAQVREYLAHPLVKVGMILLVWAFAHHFFAGVRFLLLDLHKGIEKEAARFTAGLAIAAGIVVTLVVGARIW